MCAICGCEGPEHEHPHHHGHGRERDHDHRHDHRHVELETRILARNDALAKHNASWLQKRGVVALNLMGAPGSGKTSLLERTIRAMPSDALLVIEGDQATANDAERIRAAGAVVVQLNTGTGCHLDAHMVGHALAELDPRPGALVAIENIGNLVCPALFRLGEERRVVVLSVTEGDDKPLKYPHMFRAADLVLLNKIDLLPHVDFSVERAATNARALNPRVGLLQVSARSGEGLGAWIAWLEGLGDRAERRVERPGDALRIEG